MILTLGLFLSPSDKIYELDDVVDIKLVPRVYDS